MSKLKRTFKIGGGLEVNRLGYGAMRLTGKGIWGEPKNGQEAKCVLRRAVELGVNFIDTADSYGPDVSERLIGDALSPFPKGLVVATKAGLTRQGPDQWLPVGRAEYLVQQVEMSLRLLKTDVIDLWQLHRIDPKVPVEESLGAIAKLQRAGKIRYVGLSEVKPKEIERARKVIEIASVQNLYNVGDRQHEGVLEYCETHGLGFIRWFPVAAGKLCATGRQIGKIGEAARIDSLAAFARMAVASQSGTDANSRNVIGSAFGRESDGLGNIAVGRRDERNRRRGKVTEKWVTLTRYPSEFRIDSRLSSPPCCVKLSEP